MTTGKFLLGKHIGISISESEELTKLGYSDMHLRDAMIEFARHLLIQGATLVYGGDLRNGGYTEVFADLANEYYLKDRSTFLFKNYFSYPIHLNLDKGHLGDFKAKRVEVIKVEPDESLAIEKQVYVKPDTPKNKYIWAKCLTKMRQEMTEEIDARIVIGGKNYDYTGKYPGIIEETRLDLEAQKPTYLIGTFGGATLRIIKAITEKKHVIEPTNSFYQNTDYQRFKNHYNDCSEREPIDFDELNDYYAKRTINCLNNGLDEEENQRLFNTPHLQETILLVLKGFRNRVNDGESTK